MGQTLPEFLEEKLPFRMYQRLAEASAGWSIPLFAVDPETGRYECVPPTDMLDDDSPDVELLDALCTACDLLSESAVDFDDVSAQIEAEDQPGQFLLTYRFEPEEEDVFRRFQSLVQENLAADAGISGDFQKLPWGFRAEISLSYANDFEYNQKKDSVEWMLDLARMRAADRPFGGQRV